MKFLGLEVGSWADWVSGIGTIVAIVASIFITKYQLKNDRLSTRQAFFTEQESIMIKEVSNAIVNVNTEFRYIANSKTFIQKYIQQHVDYIDIEKNLMFILDNFSEYGEVKTEYYQLTMDYVKPLMEKYEDFKNNATSSNANNQSIAVSVDNVLSSIIDLNNEVISIKNKIKKTQ